jgi:hypothetical protein
MLESVRLRCLIVASDDGAEAFREGVRRVGHEAFVWGPPLTAPDFSDDFALDATVHAVRPHIVVVQDPKTHHSAVAKAAFKHPEILFIAEWRTPLPSWALSSYSHILDRTLALTDIRAEPFPWAVDAAAHAEAIPPWEDRQHKVWALDQPVHTLTKYCIAARHAARLRGFWTDDPQEARFGLAPHRNSPEVLEYAARGLLPICVRSAHTSTLIPHSYTAGILRRFEAADSGSLGVLSANNLAYVKQHHSWETRAKQLMDLLLRHVVVLDPKLKYRIRKKLAKHEHP